MVTFSAQGITAVCMVLGFIGTIAMFVIRSSIREAFGEFEKRLEARFATKEEVATLRAFLEGLREGQGQTRQHHPHE